MAYYQQVGRAGRALDAAYGVLLSGPEEMDITDYFIETAFPTREDVRRILDAMDEAPNGLTVPELLTRVNLSQGRVEKAILLLSLESPAAVVKEGTKWQLTAAPLDEAFWARAERLTAMRHAEQQQMQEYVSLTTGHMEFLIQALDGDPGHILPPALPLLPALADPALVQEVVAFLRRTNLPIPPRQQWPAGGLPRFRLTGRISPAHQAEPGRALAVWGDAGWGTLVRRGKYEDGHFGEELVNACATLVREWAPQPPPAWVTCIPSRRHPQLVFDFAARLAGALSLPFEAVLEKTDDRPEQKTMANSSQQARNIDGSLAVRTATVPRTPVLLVDDVVDSRWTSTVAAWLLRSRGSGAVFPLALAIAGRDE